MVESRNNRILLLATFYISITQIFFKLMIFISLLFQGPYSRGKWFVIKNGMTQCEALPKDISLMGNTFTVK
jgi:hypothetical protein